MAVSDRAPLLSLEDLHAAYGPVAVLRGLDLVVYPGELVCVIGANGAGKTSTLRAVSGLLAPTGGRIVFDGRPIHGAEPADVLAAGIAHCPEGRRVFPHLTVRENLEMGAYVRRDRHAVDEDLERVATHFPLLAERRRQTAGTLSGGEQQMLAIARALMARPRLVLFDEPSLGLSPALVETTFGIIADIRRRGTTVLMVEHNVRFPLGELDLVCRDGGAWVFVEVKCRQARWGDAPAAAVEWRKRRRLVRLAQHYLKWKRLGEVSCRFDVVAVTVRDDGTTD